MQSNRVIRREERFNGEELRLNETLFSNANGYIGVRGTLEEGVPQGYPTMRGMYLGGVYETIPMKQAEALCHLIEEKQTMLNVADTQTIFLTVDGEAFSLNEGTVLIDERLLDMDGGFTARKVRWKSPKGKTVKIETKRMTHFETPELFTIEYRVSAEDDVILDFTSRHIADVKNYADPNDPRLAAESPRYLYIEKKEAEEDVTVCVDQTEVSKIRIASAVGHQVSVGGAKSGAAEDDAAAAGSVTEKRITEEADGFSYHVTASLRAGEEIILIKYTAFSDSLRREDPVKTAKDILKTAMQTPIEALYEAQEKTLSAFWQNSAMEISGDDDLALSMCFNMYQLFSAAPRVTGSSIAAKGLSGEGYEGHYFWDTEMYALPFFILTDISLAKRILSYRYITLPKARENALLVGHKKGALYPWRTITGEECSGYFPSGTAAYHINGAIAYAVIQYYLASGDRDYILEEGLELLLETARLWMDTGNLTRDGRFVIECVTGPDEYTCMVNNNYYTNACAKYHLTWAARLYRENASEPKVQALTKTLGIKEAEIKAMEDAAENMYLPYDEETGINPQDDSFLDKPVWDLENTPKEEFPLLLHYHPLHLYRYQVCKQADTVLSHFLFPAEQDRETMERSFRYYEKITTHDSSLSTCVFSMQAARLGLYEEAVAYFGNSAKLDLLNLHNNTKDGLHTANMGGSYMAMVYGFAGVQITENGLSIAPFLPKSLTGYSFCFEYRGSRIKIAVSDEETTVTLLSGAPVEFTQNGQRYTVSAEETQTVLQVQKNAA